jgi:hypothetical protein
MQFIRLTCGTRAIVDDEDFERLNKYRWQLIRGTTLIPYAVRKVVLSNGNVYRVRMHHDVLGLIKPGLEIDHKNHWGLDNQKKNLRVCSGSQNRANQRIRLTSFSGFKGVYWGEKTGNWRSMISLNGKTVYLGHFNCVIKAAQAYDAAAIDIFGEYACLNFPKRSPQQAAA